MDVMMILYGNYLSMESMYGTRILYRHHVFVWIHDFEYGSVCMDISGSISRV